MCAAIELEISTFLLFCPKYSTNSPSGPTRYMMIVWSTWRQQEVKFRQIFSLICCVVMTCRMNKNRAVYNSRCSRCLRLSVPDCNKLCRLWRPPQSELVFPSGRSASGKTLKKKLCIHWIRRYSLQITRTIHHMQKFQHVGLVLYGVAAFNIQTSSVPDAPPVERLSAVWFLGMKVWNNSLTEPPALYKCFGLRSDNDWPDWATAAT